MSNLQLELCIISALKLNNPLLYDNDTLNHAANDMKKTFW